MHLSDETFVALATANRANAVVLERLPTLNLQQCYLTAGCLFQTIWNARSKRPAGWGIKDFDVFYFDDSDMSWDAENEVIQRTNALFSDLDITVEIRNQARVHLWYEQRFGHSLMPLRSTRDGIDGFLISCTCLGIEAASGELYSPNGLQDMWDGILHMNPLRPYPDLFLAKARAYQARWPWLTIVS